jgi:hypothetical protein
MRSSSGFIRSWPELPERRRSAREDQGVQKLPNLDALRKAEPALKEAILKKHRL